MLKQQSTHYKKSENKYIWPMQFSRSKKANGSKPFSVDDYYDDFNLTLCYQREISKFETNRFFRREFLNNVI